MRLALTGLCETHSMPDMHNIRLIRERCGLSQQGLGDLLGVDQSTVSRWETRNAEPPGPAKKLLERLAKESQLDKGAA